ncbi:MAG: peptidoglycan-binding protein [Pyrinomonadaceae bacterium]|nr:peptidoglycan-binding protein [Pyrinomonadaceae bacterium]
MAYKESTEASDLMNVFKGHFWAISRSVGYGCPNNFDDVLLIQFLLNSVMNKTKLDLDGKFGSKTYNRIKSFQRWANLVNGESVLAYDGTVTAVDGSEKSYTSIKGMFTIHLLNAWYLQKFKNYFEDIRRDPAIPNDLRHLLMVSI